MSDNPLSPYDQWCVRSNLKRIAVGEVSAEANVATLRANGYSHIADAVEALARVKAVMHAIVINELPRDTRALVIDALRVRAMDFVADRLRDDAGDGAADVVRELVPDADTVRLFDPDIYRLGER